MLEKNTVEEILRFPTEGMTGRIKIKVNVSEITRENVREVLQKTLPKHYHNAAQITYLWNYYKGMQDIRLKQKYVRESINNKVTVNRANEIVTFKTAYLLNEPIQYISNGEKASASSGVAKLNEFMRAEDKESKDKELIDWVHIGGIGERMVLTDKMAKVSEGAPYYIYTLDPREAYMVYSSAIGERRLAGVLLQYDEQDRLYAMVYTDKVCFTVTADDEIIEEPHVLGDIPLFEYENNMARMGAFEAVIPILNGINELESDAIDSVEDFVNGFDVFQNCDIEDGEYSKLSLGGKAVKIKTVVQGMEAKVYRVASELSQQGVQQRVDDLTEAYLTICGMPNRNGGSSTSDTGQAVIFRDGWSEAESRAKDSEKLFVRAERQFLRVVLNICDSKVGAELGLELKDIGVNFARKSLNNLQSRFQCLMEALGSDRVHPKCAFDAFGDIFGDKNLSYEMSMKWREERENEEEENLQKQLENERRRIEGMNGGEKNNAGAVPDQRSGDDGNQPVNPEKEE